jgi:hypothetical protein
LTSPDGFRLGTATPVQRTVARLLDGSPIGPYRNHPDVVAALGRPLPERLRPKEFALLASIRSAKTLICAAAAVYSARTCDLRTRRLGPGDVPRVSLISTATDQAQPLMDHLVGHVEASPLMRRWIVGHPTSDGVMLEHESGKAIEVRVVAGARAGATLVARWSAGCIFDEAPRMVGSDAGIVNLDESRRAVIHRMLPGAPLCYIGSPWAPFGPVYDMWRRSWGQPSERLVVVRATGPMMNPGLYTPEYCAAAAAQDPGAYQTDVLAEFRDAEETIFTETMIRACVREGGAIQPERGNQYVAAMDPATRGNAWTFVVLTRETDGRLVVVYARQWTGSVGDRGRPRKVLEEIAGVCREYRVDEVHTDQFSADALADLAESVGVDLAIHHIGKPEKYETISTLHTVLSEERISLPDEPVMAADLHRVTRRVTRDGVSYDLPRTADGRHCDYVPALALAVSYPPGLPVEDEAKLDPLGERLRRARELREQPMIDQIHRRLTRGAA